MKRFFAVLAGILLFNELSKANTVMDSSAPNPGGRSRGMRNNNPGNIKETGTNWKGQLKPTQDPPFAQFETMLYGTRAMIILVKRTYRNMGLNTIRGIVSRYAPPSENITDAYINAVSRRTGLDPDRILATEQDYKNVIQAMAYHENGFDALPDILYYQANRMI